MAYWCAATNAFLVCFALVHVGLSTDYHPYIGPTRVTEQIVADMIELHNTNSSFCQLFKSQSTTEVLIECLSNLPPGHENAKICTQVTHFGLLVANGNHVSHHQKQQVIQREVGLLVAET